MLLKMLNLSIPEEANVYNNALNVLADKHPYYKVTFLDIFYDGLSNARAFVFYDESHKPIIAMPFYLRPIEQLIDNEHYYDITSTWGYSGPLYNDDLTETVLEDFWKDVDEWYKQNKVVTEFIRFNTNNNTSGYSGDLVPIMNIIKGKLSDAEARPARFGIEAWQLALALMVWLAGQQREGAIWSTRVTEKEQELLFPL